MKTQQLSIYLLSGFFLLGATTSLAQERTSKKNKKDPKNPKTTEILFNQGYMDLTVKPQEDFFRFANGTWVKNNPVPPSESRWGSFNELDKANKIKLTQILEGLKTAKNAPQSIEQMLGAYYASFTDMAKRNELGMKPIKADLAKISGMTAYTDVVTVVAEQHKYGVNSLFNIGVGQDMKDVNKNITYLGQGGIGLPNRDYYFEENKKGLLNKYKEHIKAIFKLAGYSEEDAQKAARNTVAIETRLAEKMMTQAELRVPENSYNKLTKKEAEALFGSFDFDKYLSLVGSQSFDQVIVGQPDFIKNVAKLVKGTSIEQMKDYLSWCTLRSYSAHLDDKFVNENFLFYQGAMSGKTQMKPLNELAINEITEMTISEALGKLFVQKYFSEKAMTRVNGMVDNLLATYNDRIQTLSWMSDSTKLEALKKLNSIGRKLGFPTKWEDFSDLELTADDYIGNRKKCAYRDVAKNFAELYKPIDKEKWGMPAHLVNAYYNPLLNEIAFPAGIMQPPFFDENAEDALNYGRIGMVIGHEFTHGFDDMGSKFAADGSFTNWWSETDRSAFEEKTKVLGETFSVFCPIEGHCVNPELTMGENIADLGGITLAYYAYSKTDEFKSGALKNGYNPAQRFFISFAQLWKINYTDAELKKRIAGDEHSPGMYRVNGPLKNCPEFFSAFDVKEGDAMRNAALKVARIW
ncbi:MAG: M13 family metallopeptidase [Bacteroidota bacterium]